MASNIPVVRQIAWVSILPQAGVLGAFVYLWHFVYPQRAILLASLSYLLLSVLLRKFLCQAHNRGIQAIHAEKFEQAILDFEESCRFFEQYQWIDQYRFVTLLSSSKMSYQVMALNNIAFCYSQLGNGLQAKYYYQQALQLFPENSVAKVALRLLESKDNPSEPNRTAH